MRISIPSLAAAALIVAGCGLGPTGVGGGSGGATDAGSGAGSASDAGSGSGGGAADGGSASGPGDSAPDGGSGSGGPATHTLTVELSGNANGSVASQPAGIACGPSCSASFPDGTDVVLTATAASGSTLKACGGACSGSTTTCTVRLTGDAQVTAEFQPAATQDECAGLAPGNPGAPVRLQATDRGNSCEAATSDGSGNVAANIGGEGPTTIVRLFDRSGAALGRFQYQLGPVFEQLAGFAGTTTAPGVQVTDIDVFALDTHGNEIGRDNAGPVLAAAEDPTGGMVVFSLARGNPPVNVLVAYDGGAHLRWKVALANGVRGAGGRITLGVDRLGNTLVLIAEDAVAEFRGQWVDHDGHAGPQFIPTVDVGGDPVNSDFVLAPRVGDGLFLQGRSPQVPGWVAQFESLATAAQPPPSWLISRPLGERVHMARGGRAYAFFPRGPCDGRIEILAPSGKSCGTAVFPTAACIDVGYDGTVIQPFDEQRHSDSTVTCTWQSWPGFLH